MCYFVRAAIVCFGLAAADVSNAQVYIPANPITRVAPPTASGQLDGDPVVHAGSLFYPTGPTVFFDADVMRLSGVDRGRPLYQDITIQPFSIVYVPIGRNLMRPYERRREGELAGTTGSRMPSFPVQLAAELSTARTMDDGEVWGDEQVASSRGDVDLQRGDACCGSALARLAAAMPGAPAAMPMVVQSIPPPQSGDGVWIEFEGARYYSDGVAVLYDADRFLPLGDYRGFPVYRDSAAVGERIFVTVVRDGPLAPYAKRPGGATGVGQGR